MHMFTRQASRRGSGSGAAAPDRNREDEPIQQPNPNPDLTMGIQFRDINHERRYAVVLNFPRFNTRFPHMSELKKLYIKKGVQKLFQNIGWEGLLTKRLHGYVRPTLEFVSSVDVQNQILTFRLFDRDRHMTFADIASTINAPIESPELSLFGPFSAPGFHLATFWQSITDNGHFRPGQLKASDIVHPVLRVAHRILACTVYAREEPSTVNTQELGLLYHMIYPAETLPDFGAFVCHKLKSYRTKMGGAILCGGIVTLLSTHPSIPSIPTNLEEIPGDYRLGYNQLLNMQMFEPGRERGTFTWNLGVGHRPFLTVTEANKRLLSLGRPISDTDWRLLQFRDDDPQNVGPIPPHYDDDVFSANSSAEAMEQEEEPPQHAGPPPGVHPWIYNQMSTMAQNQARMEASFQSFVIDQNATNEEQRKHNERYGGVIDNMWNWMQGNPPPPPPGYQ